MSKNNKNRRNLERARSFTALHKSGQKGPAKTQKKTTKVNVWWRSHESRVYKTANTARRSDA